jgi:DNA-binding IclR family transcriptional regulator
MLDRQDPRHQISQQGIRVVEALRAADGWLTMKEIVAAAGVKDRTAMQHARDLTALGLFDVAKLHGGYRYRLSKDLLAPAIAYLERLAEARQAVS